MGSKYRTAPIKTDKMPPGIGYIVGNEAAERFSYYGMNGILVYFMMHYMLNAQGQPDHMTKEQAGVWYHTFVFCTYGLPLLGAFLADALFGKYFVIFWLSIVYCFGHFALAINDTRLGLMIGLGLIAMGAGGIKPCVSANVGDQFGSLNQHLLPKVFSWFYFSINFGAAFSTIICPWLLDPFTAPAWMVKTFPAFAVHFLEWCHGPRFAFGLPGIAMVIATIVFWMGRNKIVHRPPSGLAPFFSQFAKAENLRALGNILILVPFAAVFWSLWQQNFSSWVDQADKMDRHMFGVDWLTTQIQTVNPLFVLLMLPFTAYILYPMVDKVVKVTPLRKFGAGLFMIIFSFLIVAWIQTRLDAGQKPHIIWQILAFLVLTLGEVLVSVTHLEFAYTQAPKTMKSLVMFTYLGSIALGNAFTALVDYFIQNPDGTVKLVGAAYFFFFVKVMLVTAILWLIVSPFYRGKTFIDEDIKAEAA
jgi:POT family proton-dependent oligopeptide transporter